MSEPTPPANTPSAPVSLEDQLKLANEKASLLRELLELQKTDPRKPSKAEKGQDPRKHFYYRPSYGEAMAHHLRAMAKDRQSRIFRFAAFPAESRNTIYLKLKFGMDYAMDKLLTNEPDVLAYAQKVRLKKAPTGYCMSYIADEGQELLRAEIAGPSDLINMPDISVGPDMVSWQDALSHYIDTAITGSPLKLERLKLSEEEVAKTRLMLGKIPNMIFSVMPDRINVVKVSADDYLRYINSSAEGNQ